MLKNKLHYGLWATWIMIWIMWLWNCCMSIIDGSFLPLNIWHATYYEGSNPMLIYNSLGSKKGIISPAILYLYVKMWRVILCGFLYMRIYYWIVKITIYLYWVLTICVHCSEHLNMEWSQWPNYIYTHTYVCMYIYNPHFTREA